MNLKQLQKINKYRDKCPKPETLLEHTRQSLFRNLILQSSTNLEIGGTKW